MILSNLILFRQVRTGSADQLFDFIAVKIEDFYKTVEHKFDDLPPAARPLVFTFSFPVRQTSLSNGVLLHWTKDYDVDGAVGIHVPHLLNMAMAPIEAIRDFSVAGLINDSVACLVSGARSEPEKCKIGLILGTGCNAAYIEDVDAVEGLFNRRVKYGKVILSTE
jgi:hexokinase